MEPTDDLGAASGDQESSAQKPKKQLTEVQKAAFAAGRAKAAQMRREAKAAATPVDPPVASDVDLYAAFKAVLSPGHKPKGLLQTALKAWIEDKPGLAMPKFTELETAYLNSKVGSNEVIPGHAWKGAGVCPTCRADWGQQGGDQGLRELMDRLEEDWRNTSENTQPGTGATSTNSEA